MVDVRQSSVNLLAGSLQKSNGEQGDNTAQSIAQQLEEAVYAKHNGDTGNAYRDQLRSLSLDVGKNNVELAKDLLGGRITAQELIDLGPEGLKSTERAQQDDEIQEQNLRESLGSHKIPVSETGDVQIGSTAATDLSHEGVAAYDDSMGEEGDFKARAQPKIQGLEGIEFESGM